MRQLPTKLPCTYIMKLSLRFIFVDSIVVQLPHWINAKAWPRVGSSTIYFQGSDRCCFIYDWHNLTIILLKGLFKFLDRWIYKSSAPTGKHSFSCLQNKYPAPHDMGHRSPSPQWGSSTPHFLVQYHGGVRHASCLGRLRISIKYISNWFWLLFFNQRMVWTHRWTKTRAGG